MWSETFDSNGSNMGLNLLLQFKHGYCVDDLM